MSRDLEEQLDELGPAYRDVVARLRAAREAEPGEARRQATTDSRRRRLSFEAIAKPRSLRSRGTRDPTKTAHSGRDARPAHSGRDARPARPQGKGFAITSFVVCRLSYLVAASLLVVVGLAVLFFKSANHPITQSDIAYTVRVTDAERAYALAVLRDDKAVQELIRTQNPDGSWKTDDLTRRNAELLKTCRSEAAQAAYRKAMDNLRARGLL